LYKLKYLLFSCFVILTLIFSNLPQVTFAGAPFSDTVLEEDTVSPAVVSTYPENNAHNIPLTASIIAVFSESMDNATIDVGNFTLKNGSNLVDGTVNYNPIDKTATFKPINFLEYNTSYTATVSTGVTDLAGNELDDIFIWSFTTKESNVVLSVGSQPTVFEESTLDIDVNISGADNVSAYELMLNFDDSVLQMTGVSDGLIGIKSVPNISALLVGDDTILLMGYLPDADGASGQGKLVRVHFNVIGNAGQTSQLTLSNIKVFDILGQPMPLTKSDGSVNVIAPLPVPMILSIDPNSGKQGWTGLPVVITGDNLTGTTALSFSGTGVTAVNFSVASSTRITAEIDIEYSATTGDRDVSIDAPGGISTLHNGFTVVDGHAPVVLSTNPANKAIDIAINTSITATFSESIQSATINQTNFVLLNGTVPIDGEAAYKNDDKTATFTPANNLAPNTKYTVILTRGVTDLAGNALPDNYSWNFTTGSIPDSIPPSIISTNPVNGMTGVAANIAITARFSEDIDVSTITSDSLKLLKTADQTAVEGLIYCSDGTVVFQPKNDLDLLTEYTAVITTAVTDLAGNALAENYTWSFTTGSIVDILPAVVISTNPANGEIDVSPNTLVSAVFSESIMNSTINTASFILMKDDIPTTGIVTYDDESRTATFTPTNNLSYGANYTATITGEVTDKAGNAMAENFTWSFTIETITNTSLAVSNNPSTFGENITFTVSVNEGMLLASITNGLVRFMDGIELIGTGMLNTSGQASYSTAALSVRTHTITAIFEGDSIYPSSTSEVLYQVVNKASSATTVSSSVNPSLFEQSVTFTALVTPVLPATTVPTGNVTFKNGSLELDTISLNGLGKADYTSSDLISGSHSITAVYNGDTNYLSGVSNPLTQGVNPPVLKITTNSLPDGDQKAAYSQNISASYGAPPYIWSIVKISGESLPNGLKLNSDSGIISGKPTKPGTFNFTVKVTDNLGASDQDNYTINIHSAVALEVPKIPTGEANVEFPYWAPTASGGDDNYTWLISKGTLPGGLTLDNTTGIISGIPDKEVYGTFPVTLKVTDGVGGSASKSFSIKILKILLIDTSSLPSCDVGVTYKSTTLKATGGTGKYTWTILEGNDALPPGLSLLKATIKGKPADNSSGDYTFTIQVSDTLSEVTQEFSIKINDPLEFSVDPDISADPDSPEIMLLGDTVEYNISPVGGSGIYKFSVSGTLPKGLKLITTTTEDTTTYSIQGTSIKTGNFKFTLKLTDSLKGTKTRIFYIKVETPG
jgi:hypothetical protein